MSLKGQTEDINLEWLVVIVLALVSIFVFAGGSESTSYAGAGAPAAHSPPPPRVSMRSSLSSRQAYTVSFSCAALQMAAGGGLRLVPPEVLWACRQCNEGIQSACEKVHQYIQEQQN